MKATQHEEAVKLEEALKFVNELRVPVVSRDDKIGLKERAKLARQLFKELGLKGLSVRVATGAWCLWVEVHIPMMEHDESAHKERRAKADCASCIYYAKARLALQEILLRAFPKEIDESNPMTDYFAPAWTFHEGTGRGLRD